MKKTYMTGSKGVSIFMIFWCGLTLIGPIAFLSVAVSMDDLSMLPILIGPLAFFVFGIVVLIKNSKSVSLINKVKANGRKSTGEIVDKQLIRGKTTISLRITVKFVTDDGNEALVVLPVDENLDDYMKGVSIPILVYKDYAYFDDVEQINSYKKESFKFNNTSTKKKELICDACGTVIKDGLIYCPKCGKAVEDIPGYCDNKDECVHTNYCPKCGEKLNPDDNFCSKCGYRVK